MFNLLRTEFFKLKKFYIGYIAVLLVIAAGLAYGHKVFGYSAFSSTDNTSVVFSYVISDTSFVFFISIIAALFMGKDFSNRTICNEIKLGYSRFQILLSRIIAVYAFAALFHAVYVIATVVGFSVVRGFDTSVFCPENLLWLLTVLIQLMAVLSGVVLITFLAKKVTGAIALSTVYAFTCCNILRNFMENRVFTSSCFYFVQDSSPEKLVFAAASAFVTMIIFVAVTALAFNRAEIK